MWFLHGERSPQRGPAGQAVKIGRAAFEPPLNDGARDGQVGLTLRNVPTSVT
jgi:hypothetical protein